MSSQTISRAVVWTLAVVALILSVGVAAVGVIFTTAGLAGMGSLLTVGSLFLFMVIGFVTGALAATSIRLWRAAQRLPPTSLSPEAVAQEKRKGWRLAFVSFVAIAAILLAGFSLTPHPKLLANFLLIFNHGELAIPVFGLIFGIYYLLIALLRCPPAPYVPVSLYYLTGGAFTLLGVVAVLALLLGVTLGGVYIWTVIVGLGFIVIFWLSALYLLYVGERLLHQGTAMSSSPSQS